MVHKLSGITEFKVLGHV